MRSRRSFLGTMTGGVAAASALRGLARASGTARPPLGLQLWSLRALFEKDVTAACKLIRSWGFEEVETAGFHGRTASGFAGDLKAAGLRCRAMHVGWERLQQDLPGVLREADTLGATTVVNPSLPHKTERATREEILTAASAFAGWARTCRAAGKRFAYHVHSQEFGPAPEGTLFDLLAKEAGPDVGFELDVFWVVWGGGDPVKLLHKYPGRVYFTHLKDMAKGVLPGRPGQDRDKLNVPLGAGQIDVRGIVAAAAKAGVELHYLEDESPDPLANIPKSIAYYQSL